MKKPIFIAFVFVILAIDSPAQSQGPRLEFIRETIDLGTLSYRNPEVLEIRIEFRNTGTYPLIVSGAGGCCGTRIMEWTKHPVLPGDTGTVVAEIRPSPHPHILSRVITVDSNDPEGQKNMRIIARIEAATGAFNPVPRHKAPSVR